MSSRGREITQSHLLKHFDYHYVSITGKWAAWARNQVVLLRLNGVFTEEEADRFMNECWGILMERKRQWPMVYAFADLNDFEVQAEEIRTYLRKNWWHLLQRNDLHISLIVGKSMKAIIWHSIHLLMGTRDRIKIFGSHRKAFDWLWRRLHADVTK